MQDRLQDVTCFKELAWTLDLRHLTAGEGMSSRPQQVHGTQPSITGNKSRQPTPTVQDLTDTKDRLFAVRPCVQSLQVGKCWPSIH